MMLAQVWLCMYIIVLVSDDAGEASPGSLIVDFGPILYVVLVSGGIGAS